MSKDYIIVRKRCFYEPNPDIYDLVGDQEYGYCAAKFDGKATAVEYVKKLDGRVYYLSHNEYARPDYTVYPADQIPKRIQRQLDLCQREEQMKKMGNDFSDKSQTARQNAEHYLNDYIADEDDRCLTAHALMKAAAELWEDGTQRSNDIAHRAFSIAERAFGDYLDERHPELIG